MSKKKSGCMIGDKWVSFYDQGYNAYMSHQKYRAMAGHSWCAGWRAARDSDLLLMRQVHKPKALLSVAARLSDALGFDVLKAAA